MAGLSPLKPDSATCAQGAWSGWWSAGQDASQLLPPWLYRYPFTSGPGPAIPGLQERLEVEIAGTSEASLLGIQAGIRSFREEGRALKVWDLFHG